MKQKVDKTIVCVVGLGYVGLPLAMAFAKNFRVIGFDIATAKVKKLKKDNNSQKLLITDDPKEISQASFIIICVPTPVTKSKEPDLTYIKNSAKIVGQNMKKDSVVILESTVYPGVTEEIVTPILEEESTLKCGEDFKIAYSPERINPGDEEHTIDKIIKVVAGMDDKTTELVTELYRKVAANVFKARDIKTAEAAKVIENIQRDLNIALINELSLIFDKMGLSTKDVIKAAATKWNFHHYSPGLVGGHCIPVDPYYLVYKAKELGFHPQVILAGRAINDYMPKHVAEMIIKALNDVGKVIKNSKILIMGLTYKENVVDTREAPVRGIIKELKEYGVEIYGYDPLLSENEANFGINTIQDLEEIPKVDAVILTVAHHIFEDVTLEKLIATMNLNPILMDICGYYNKEGALEVGFHYRSL
ncbi:nucleotide sugar dehydrogenase [Chloroflexota bacterium]